MNGEKKVNTTRLEIKIPHETKVSLEKLASTLNVSVSDLVRPLINAVASIKTDLRKIELREIGWLDDYNGRPAHITYAHGFRIEDENISKVVDELVRIAYDKEPDFFDIYATVEYGIVIQYRRTAINPYGNPVGSDWWWEPLEKLVERARQKRRKLSLERLKDAIIKQLASL